MLKTPSECGKLGYLKIKDKLLSIHNDKNKKLRSDYYLNPKTCIFCNKIISYENKYNKFCGHSCSASFNNKSVAHNLKATQYKNNKCLNCGKETNRKTYCSFECGGEYKRKQTVLKINETGCIPSRNTARTIMIKECNNTCAICKTQVWQNKPVHLLLDHINGNADDNRIINIRIINIRMICPNCDAQLSTYKGRNKGKGRYSRRLRYQQGKSF